MAKKKNDEPKVYKEHPSVDRRITDTLRENYMPYAMSVIVSRAIPEIDGFKPSHRKLLYTMYKMGLLNGNRTKSANIVGQTMKLSLIRIKCYYPNCFIIFSFFKKFF